MLYNTGKLVKHDIDIWHGGISNKYYKWERECKHVKRDREGNDIYIDHGGMASQAGQGR